MRLHDVPHRVLLLRLFYFHPHLKYRKAPTLLHPELPDPEYPAYCIQALKKRTPSAPLTDGRKSGRLPRDSIPESGLFLPIPAHLRCSRLVFPRIHLL